MKQCPQCKRSFSGPELFCEECGIKLVEVDADVQQTGAESGRTVAAFGDGDRTVFVDSQNQSGSDTATVYQSASDQQSQGYNTQAAGYNSGREQDYSAQAPNNNAPNNYGGQPQGNGRVQSHVGQAPRDYSDARNYGPRNYGGQPQNRGSQRPAAPRQKKPRKPIKISKKIWIALAEVVLLIALIVVFNAVGNSKTDPVDSALNYFNAMLEGDYKTITKLTDLPESPFLTEEAFQKCCEEWSLLSSESNITKVSAKEYDASSYYSDYYDYYGYSDYYGSGSSSSTGGMSDYTKAVQVEYMLSGDPEVYTYYMQLVSGEEKVMFFFNKWEVVQCTPFLAEDFVISVPSGATLVMDGYVVDETFLQPKEDEYDQSDKYMLDLFVGTHTITVLVDGIGEATAEYYVSGSYDSYYFYDDQFELSEETKNAVVAQAKALMEQVYTAALAKDTAENALVGFSGTAAEEMTSEYEYFVEDLHYDEGRTMNKITLDEFEVYSCYVDISDGVPYVYLDLEFQGNFEYSYRDGATKKTNSYDDYLGFSASYQCIDGVWTPVVHGYFDY